MARAPIRRQPPSRQVAWGRRLLLLGFLAPVLTWIALVVLVDDDETQAAESAIWILLLAIVLALPLIAVGGVLLLVAWAGPTVRGAPPAVEGRAAIVAGVLFAALMAAMFLGTGLLAFGAAAVALLILLVVAERRAPRQF